MSNMNDQYSDSSSEINWPLDHPIQRSQDDRVIFENVADQYVKDTDVTAFFTILHDINVNPDEDQIGLLRVGCTNIKECLAYAPVQYNPSTSFGSARHGTATFHSSDLPVTDDEFYQFCYIVNKTKNLGSSIPFQLNCASDDIDLLSNVPVRKTRGDGLIALADHDNDDILVVHTKSTLTEEKLRLENRNLFETNRRLEFEKEEVQIKYNLLEATSKEHSAEMFNEIQTLTSSYKTVADELAARKKSDTMLNNDYNACRALCVQYKTEIEQHAERCRLLESSYSQISTETNQLRSQLALTSQITKDQATHIVDLEHRLMQAKEIAKETDQHQLLLEQQLNDLRLTSEQNQTQIGVYIRQLVEKDDQIAILQATNNCLQSELRDIKEDYEALLLISEKNRELSETLQKQLDELCEQHSLEKESAQNEIKLLKGQLNEIESVQEAYMTLKTSYKEIERRCVKHQKNEIEAKKQLTANQEVIYSLKLEIEDLKHRLADGAEAYKILFRKFASLEQKGDINPQLENRSTTALTNSYVNDNDPLEDGLRNDCVSSRENHEQLRISIQHVFDNSEKEVDTCPMCYSLFPLNMNLDDKRQHIESHFQ